jgi:recombination protein RecT
MTQTRNSGAVAVPGDEKTASVARYIASLEPEIARALPQGMKADRVARIALTLIRQSELQAQKDRRPNSSLAKCSPESFAGALLTASALGLEPGINGEAYLVNYSGECSLIVGYQGLTKLFWQHPMARYIDAHAVYEADEFDYAYGRNQFIAHKPTMGTRGRIVAYWAAGELANGAFRFVVLSPDEVRELRGGKVGPSGKIADPMHWMERKTALRQLLKLLPKSVTMAAALIVDEQRGSVLAQGDVPAAIAAGDPLPALPPTYDEQPTAPQVTGAEILAAAPERESIQVSGPEPGDVADAEEMISQAQNTKLHACLNSCGLTSRPDVLKALAQFTGRPTGSSNELTANEASDFLDALDRIVSNDNPGAALDNYLADRVETRSE